MTGRDAPPDDAGEAPPGLQRERTLLAWTRTLLALVVVTILLMRVVGAPWARPAHLPAAVVLGVALGLFVAVDLRHRRGTIAAPGLLGAVAVATTLVGAMSTVALLAG